MIIIDSKMKTKKRTINTESNIYKKKINTRNMHSKSLNESNISGNNTNSTRGKPSPNTRAKTNCVIKSHSDPYAFSKIDDEDKIPLKRIKVTEKVGKEIGVNTSSLSTMTEPEYLGPCEPGTSIELQGIVWLETATGLLVINVTWRGRTYVGTLMDSTKYEFTPSLSQENLGKFEGRPSNRSTRGKKRQVGNPGNHFSLRSNNIRHSRRLNESMNASNTDGMIKKLSTRQTNNLINYFDSTNQSATASASGDSDTDKNSYSKFSTSSKTRSVTRSITKLNKTALCDYNSNSIDDNNINLIPCSKENCFKRFVDLTAYQYHVQRCHNNSIKENLSNHDVADDTNSLSGNNIRNNSIKIEPTNNEIEINSNIIDSSTQENATVKASKLNGIINKEINIKMSNFEFNSDSETEKCLNKLPYNYIENKGDLKISEKESNDPTNDVKPFIKSESMSPQFQELSVTLPKVSENVIVSSDILLPTTCSIRETFSCNSEDRPSAISIESTASISKSTSSTLKNLSQSVSDFTSSTTVISHSSPSIRTVTAPTVSIPVELINTSNNFTNSTISCPTLIRPKPNQNPVGSANHSTQNRKFKSTKSSSQTNGATESFQIPSSTPVIIKKRPLVPLKVSVNQNTSTTVNRMYPITSHLNVSSPNPSSRHIRSSSISPVTPILPATSTTISTTSSISSTSSITGQSTTNSLNNMYHNGQSSVRRTSVTTNLTSTTGLSTLGSLKPIQPKPKSSQFSSTVTTSHLGINTSPYPVSQSIIVPSISGISNIHISHQRQILPSPISKSDCSASIDENLIHKIESLKNSSLKRKRRKPEKKIRLNFHESNRYKKFTLNPIQPKHIINDHFPSKLNSDEFCISSEKYKTDEENSHSPGYSDLSETNDTPAPILEKEIDLKTGDCDKLVICTDFDRISSYRHNSSSSENYDDPKDLSNKPPALMPAVLSSDLVNGSTNELDYRDVKPRASRKKPLTSKRAHKVKDIGKGKLNSEKSVGSDWINVSTSNRNSVSQSSNRKSFQLSSSGIQQTLSSVPLITSQSQILSLPNNEFPSTDSNKFISINRNTIQSAINDYSRVNKTNGENSKTNKTNKQLDSTFQSNHLTNEDNGKTRSKSSKSPSNNNSGKFSVQALTSPQDIVSRSLSFSTSSVPSIIPNNKSSKN